MQINKLSSILLIVIAVLIAVIIITLNNSNEIDNLSTRTDIDSTRISIVTNYSYETSIESLPLLPNFHTEFEYINNCMCYWRYLHRLPQYLAVLCYSQTSIIFTEVPYNLLNRTFVPIEPRVPFRCRAEPFYDDILHTNIWVLVDTSIYVM